MTRVEKVKKYKSMFTFATLTFLVASFKTKLLVMLGLINNLGAVAFVGGLLYSYSVTTPISLLFFHALNGNLAVLALIAAFGSMIADYAIFRLVKDKLISELEAFVKDEIGFDIGNYLRKAYNVLQNSKVGKLVLMPTLASLVIASPLPDEIGIGMLASFKLDDRVFMVISFILNFLGIAAVLGILKLAMC